MEIYFLALGMLFAGGLLSVIVKEDWKFKLCSIFSLLASVLLLLPAGAVLLTGGTLAQTVYMSPILGDVEFMIDPLSAFFVLVISIMSFLGTVYANGYMKPYLNKGMNVSSHCFFLMMLFPLFPDDILCLVVGATGMSYKFFLITNIITRPIGIISTCFLGSGHLIPFSGWGIPVWIMLIVVGAILFYLSFKFQPQIENFVLSLAEKITKKGKKQLKTASATATATECIRHLPTTS